MNANSCISNEYNEAHRRILFVWVVRCACRIRHFNVFSSKMESAAPAVGSFGHSSPRPTKVVMTLHKHAVPVTVSSHGLSSKRGAQAAHCGPDVCSLVLSAPGLAIHRFTPRTLCSPKTSLMRQAKSTAASLHWCLRPPLLHCRATRRTTPTTPPVAIRRRG